MNTIVGILIENIHQLNKTMQNFHQLNQRKIDQLRDEFNQTIQNTYQLYQENIDQLKNELNQTVQNTHQLNQQHIYELRDEFNETMQIMQTNMDNYIASNDFELKAINDTYYAVKTPLVIAVPSSDEIDDHRGGVSKCDIVVKIYFLRQN